MPVCGLQVRTARSYKIINPPPLPKDKAPSKLGTKGERPVAVAGPRGMSGGVNGTGSCNTRVRVRRRSATLEVRHSSLHASYLADIACVRAACMCACMCVCVRACTCVRACYMSPPKLTNTTSLHPGRYRGRAAQPPSRSWLQVPCLMPACVSESLVGTTGLFHWAPLACIPAVHWAEGGGEEGSDRRGSTRSARVVRQGSGT